MTGRSMRAWLFWFPCVRYTSYWPHRASGLAELRSSCLWEVKNMDGWKPTACPLDDHPAHANNMFNSLWYEYETCLASRRETRFLAPVPTTYALRSTSHRLELKKKTKESRSDNQLLGSSRQLWELPYRSAKQATIQNALDLRCKSEVFLTDLFGV